MFLVTTLHTMSNYLAKYGQAMFCLKICESKIWTLSTFCIRMCCTMYKRENLLIILLFPTLATPRTSDHCILCTFLFICFLNSKYFLRRLSTDSLQLLHMMRLKTQQKRCNADFLEVPPKINPGQKMNKTAKLQHNITCPVVMQLGVI